MEQAVWLWKGFTAAQGSLWAALSGAAFEKPRGGVLSWQLVAVAAFGITLALLAGLARLRDARAARKPLPPAAPSAAPQEEPAVQFRRELAALHRLNAAIPDPALSARIARMEKAGEGMLEQAEADPAKWKTLRTFSTYYLPQAVHILERYAAILPHADAGPAAQAVLDTVERNAETIAVAFERQLDQLYASEAMDTEVDLTVLRQIAARDDLLGTPQKPGAPGV